MRERWDTDKNVDLCIGVARKLLRRYPNARIFSLGQSPAWVVKTVGMIVDIEGKAVKTGYIPFSGRLYKNDEHYSKEVQHYILKESPINPCIRPMNEPCYRILLSTLGFDPETIIQKDQEGQQTILLEYAQSAESLVSFISVVYDWPKSLVLKHN